MTRAIATPARKRFGIGGPELGYGLLDTGSVDIVYVHGLGARWQVFKLLISAVGPHHGQLAVDLRGHGVSDRTPGDYRLAEFASDIATVIRTECSKPVVLFGHSLGGWISMAVAAKEPDLVGALVIADSALHPVDFDPEVGAKQVAGMPLSMRPMAKSVRETDPELVREFGSGRLMKGFRPDDLLSRITAPVLLVQGDPAAGGLMTDDDLIAAERHLQHVRVLRLPDVGHDVQIQEPVQLAREVIALLATFGGRKP